MKFLSVLSLGLLVLGGCKSTPEQYLTEPAITIELSNLQNYWAPKTQTFSFKSRTFKQPKTSGAVKVKYLIDSNGEIFNPIVVESLPKGSWDKHALGAVSKFKYMPSKANSSKTPVYVTMEIKFEPE